MPVNHASRAWYAQNQSKATRRDQRRYVEVTNAQHFDAFLPGGAVFAGYDQRFVPLHMYFVRALDAMYAHLTHGRRAAAVAGRAHDAALRPGLPVRRAADHGGQRAADRRGAAGIRSHPIRQGHADGP